MRALYLYFAEASRSSRDGRLTNDGPLVPIEPGAFARWMASRKLAAASGGLAPAIGTREPLPGHALRPTAGLAVRPRAESTRPTGSAGPAVADALAGLTLSRPAVGRTSLPGATLSRTTVSRATTSR